MSVLGESAPNPSTPGPSMWWRVLLAGAVAVQLAVLYWPRTPSVGGGLGLDKVVHLLVFAAVVVTGYRAGVAVKPLAGVLVVHAGVSEVLQATALPDRSGDLADVAADVAGVLAGLAVVAVLRARDRAGVHDGDHAGAGVGDE